MMFWNKKTPEPTQPTQSAPADEPTDADEVDEFTLAEVRHDPQVAAALTGAPPVWRNCSYLDEDDPAELDMALEELLDFVYVSYDDGWWELGLGDEVFASLNLDAPEDQDALVATLLGHDSVDEAYHEDREVYRFRGHLSTADAAGLVARALVAGHGAALRHAGLD